MDTTKIGDYIRAKRKLNGWSQEILAEKVGVSSRIISDWENGKVEIKYNHIEKIATVFNVSPIEVHNGKDMPELDETTKESLSQAIIPVLETIEERGLLALEMGSYAAGIAIIAFSVACGTAFPQNTLSSLIWISVGLFGFFFMIFGKHIIKKKQRLVNKLKRTEKQDK